MGAGQATVRVSPGTSVVGRAMFFPLVHRALRRDPTLRSLASGGGDPEEGDGSSSSGTVAKLAITAVPLLVIVGLVTAAGGPQGALDVSGDRFSTFRKHSTARMISAARDWIRGAINPVSNTALFI